jgi:hypothetical protein
MEAKDQRFHVAGARPAAVVCTTLLAIGLAATEASAVEPSSQFNDRPLDCAEANGRVSEIKIMGSTAYVGGSFTQMTDPSGQVFARAGAAAINTSTCAVLPWNPSVAGEVLAIAPTSNAVYLGGKFNRVGGLRRINLAAVNPTSGSPSSFAPKVKGKVEELGTSATTLYASGAFKAVNDIPRGKAAAFSLVNGALSADWTPTVDKRIQGMAVSPDGSRVYLAGAFTNVNGDSSGRRFAAVDGVNGRLDTRFDPAIKYTATEVLTVGSQVAAAFAGPGGRVGVFDLSGNLQAVGVVDGNAQAIALKGDELVGGGHSGNYCLSESYPCDADSIRRTKAWSTRISDGALTDFAPQFNSTFGVWALAYDPATGRLFAGGDFTEAGSRPVSHLAAFVS